MGNGYLKGPVQVFPAPIALDDLKHSGSGRQELSIGQIGGVHRDEDPSACNDLQLLVERCGGIELHHSHLHHRQAVTLLSIGGVYCHHLHCSDGGCSQPPTVHRTVLSWRPALNQQPATSMRPRLIPCAAERLQKRAVFSPYVVTF